jgi:diguanylate cyclase (GGDEF)-like protein
VDPLTAFFCPTEADRERLLDLETTLRRARLLTYASIAVALGVLGLWIQWWNLLLVAALAVGYELAIRRRLSRSDHPALLVIVGFVMNVAVTAGGVVITGGPHSPLLPWLIIPIVSLAGRFDGRGVWCGTGLVLVALGAVAITQPHALVENPTMVIAIVPLSIAVGLFSAAMMRAERRQRAESSLDPLTGLLNRKSLQGRVGELAEQARMTGESVALIALDVDHFKQINDTYGHARGDDVLRAIAGAIRGELRSFELAYRVGGEEFLIVLPGIDLEHGTGVAERLRERMASLRPDGIGLTVSLGVSAGRGDEVTFVGLFDAADRALYSAKRGGRNRVEALSLAGTDDRAVAEVEALVQRSGLAGVNELSPPSAVPPPGHPLLS